MHTTTPVNFMVASKNEIYCRWIDRFSRVLKAKNAVVVVLLAIFAKGNSAISDLLRFASDAKNEKFLIIKMRITPEEVRLLWSMGEELRTLLKI